MSAPFNLVNFIIEYEDGQLSEDEINEGFQHLVDDGLIGQLQGSYGRMAQSLIDAGLVTP